MSISCIFWSYQRPVDKQHVFKVWFPYYIIILTALCLAFIVKFDSLLAIYYFSSVYLIALLIWRSELKPSIKKHENFAVEPNHPKLP
ncbi:hypothetical protein [Winogradskyella pulchriflava]|uniref:Uncharacterized protein n=1 Tax=Winogradskyella pulchriflava TaxID=1110688 RepID=A0ABV6QCG6_9FLAO